MGGSGESGLAGIRPRAALHSGRESHEGGGAGCRGTQQSRDDRAERGPTAWRLVIDSLPGHALERRVASFGADDRADHGQAVHHRSHPRQVLADPDSRHRGRDRLKFASNLRRRLHLQVEHVLVRGSSGEEHHDDRFLRPGPAGGFGGEQLRERESSDGSDHRQAADLQHVASGQLVTERRGTRGSQDREHGQGIQCA